MSETTRTIRITSLKAQGEETDLQQTTVAQRLAMMDQLALDAWAFKEKRLTLNRDYYDMLSALCDAKSEFLVVGAFALAAHGYPRATGDIDIWVRRTVDNASRVMVALQQFHAPLMGLSEEDLQTPGVVFQIGVAPRRIDILTSISAVEFEEAGRNARKSTSMDFDSSSLVGKA